MTETRDIVRDIRSEKGWTQKELGERIGIGKTQVSMVESGKSDLPAKKLLRLLDAAGWSVVSY